MLPYEPPSTDESKRARLGLRCIRELHSHTRSESHPSHQNHPVTLTPGLLSLPLSLTTLLPAASPLQTFLRALVCASPMAWTAQHPAVPLRTRFTRGLGEAFAHQPSEIGTPAPDSLITALLPYCHSYITTTRGTGQHAYLPKVIPFNTDARKGARAVV